MVVELVGHGGDGGQVLERGQGGVGAAEAHARGGLAGHAHGRVQGAREGVLGPVVASFQDGGHAGDHGRAAVGDQVPVRRLPAVRSPHQLPGLRVGHAVQVAQVFHCKFHGVEVAGSSPRLPRVFRIQSGSIDSCVRQSIQHDVRLQPCPGLCSWTSPCWSSVAAHAGSLPATSAPPPAAGLSSVPARRGCCCWTAAHCVNPSPSASLRLPSSRA
ncbi:hypothetical protein NDU88_005228 [Pleurodeles waltl]|uniref:Uncharacterized protein n=1 Tax=Pleurodeles waltl TaxID=8319 RepID=A0AAV7L0L4_PLEWA|nr:hypothetical protein NDU88_005228 [Pleurodeles waltl]